MTPTEFASFKYHHIDPAGLSQARRWFIGISLLAAVVVAYSFFPPGIFLFAVPLIAWWSAPRLLHLGPRYLLCGKTIVYYANVLCLTLSSSQGVLRVQSANGQTFVLERDKFPTGARKTDKIAKNKAAKFDKVSGKIIAKVRQASVNVKLNGI
ncbi:MAG: hypothetical protein IPN53_09295 [Comamonadaceae bacterium]|nr:hypothetical protein [Comamonadaceae bacterium]